MTSQNSPNPSDSSGACATQLTAEIISIGDEMTGGARLDTNAQWISRRLQDLGVEVTFHTTVGDTLSHNVDVFRIAANRADIVVATGGLGPTRDDLTRESLAGVVDRPLELRQDALEHIQAMFAKRKREMPERNQLQAMFPVGSDQIYNPQGTAPGVDLPVPRSDQAGKPLRDARIFALPGVPAEMKRMFDETVANRILEMTGQQKTIANCVMKFFGTGESDMELRLGDMIARDRQPRVGITVSAATISLRINAMGDDLESCVNQIADTRREILQRVGDLYFGDGEHYEQHHAIQERLSRRNESLVIIELGNAAPLGDWFASLGETACYRGGVSLANEMDLYKIAGEADLNGSLVELRQRFGADWLLLVNAYPVLDPQSDQPMPASDFHCTAITPDWEFQTMNQSLGGHPSIVQQRIAKAAMQWLRSLIPSE